MKTQDAINHFGSIAALCEAIRHIKPITAPAVYQWGAYPPDVRQLHIERVTDGKLKAEPGCMDRLMGLSPKAEPCVAAPVQAVQPTAPVIDPALALVDRRERALPISFEDRRRATAGEGS
jgi:hypothetical protein